jgi:hypothetical protein
MATTERHVYGPRPVAALLPGVTRATFRRRAPATAQVMADWAQIVGPALAAVTTPRGLSAGTLTLACAGPVAMELAHLADELRGRINAHLGSQTVLRLRFVQTIPPRPEPPAAPAPPPRAVARAAAAVAGLQPGPLRDALASLGALVLAAAPDQKPAARNEAPKEASTNPPAWR